MAFRTRTAVQEVSSAVEVEEPFDILTLRRINLHPAISGLMSRREGLQEKKGHLLQAQAQLEAERQDFEKLHALDLAEEQLDIMRQWRELKQQLQDGEDQLALVEAGLDDLAQQIDESMASVREQAQADIDALFLPEVQAMVDTVKTMLDRNRRLQEIENCSARLLQTGRLELYNAGLEGWLFLLELKLNLLSPK